MTVEPIWVGVWGADGTLLKVRIIHMPPQPEVIKEVLKVATNLEQLNVLGRLAGACGRLPVVLAALTSPN